MIKWSRLTESWSNTFCVQYYAAKLPIERKTWIIFLFAFFPLSIFFLHSLTYYRQFMAWKFVKITIVLVQPPVQKLILLKRFSLCPSRNIFRAKLISRASNEIYSSGQFSNIPKRRGWKRKCARLLSKNFKITCETIRCILW